MDKADFHGRSVVARYWTWSQERFPPISIFSAYLLYVLTASAVRHELFGKVHWTVSDFVYGFALAMTFLVLRVLDEHKDYEQDLRTRPERVLQRGIVTLKGLRGLGWLAGLATVAITLWQGSSVALICWMVMAAWITLMSYEFFCASWLKGHLFLYSVSHMLVLPLLVLWGTALAQAEALHTTVLPWILALTFVNGLIYEILRKTKGQDEEIEGVDTFSRRWGVRRAAGVGFGLHLASLVIFVLFSEHSFSPRSSYLIPLVATLLLSLAALSNYVRRPTAQQRKANEGASALYVLVAYLSLIVFSTAF